MKKIFIGLMMLMTANGFALDVAEELNSGVRSLKECSPDVQLLDSVINYSYIKTTGVYSPNYVLKYLRDRDSRLIEVVKLNLPARDTVSRQLYAYNSQDLKEWYVFQTWEDGWRDFQATNYIYNDSGFLSEEIFFQFSTSNEKIPYQHHFYYYSDPKLPGKVDYYLRRMKDSNGNWYDFSRKIYVYNEENKNIERYEQRFSDNVIFWRESLIYDENDKITERFREKLKYDTSLRRWVLKSDTHQTYNFDIFGDLSEMHQDNYYDDAWVYVGKNVYYRSLQKGKKVCICHNGHTIQVSVNALEAHLRHGDTLGECQSDNSLADTLSENISISVYPNPTSGRLTVDFKDPDHPFTDMTIYSNSGRPLMSRSLRNSTTLTVRMDDFPDGYYHVRLTGNGSEKIVTVIKNR